MRNAAIVFLASALAGALLTSASPSHAVSTGYWRRIHAHTCRTLAGAYFNGNRLIAGYGAVVAACPIPDDFDTRLTWTSAKIQVTAFYDNPNPADPAKLQVCATARTYNDAACTKTVAASTGIRAGYNEISVSEPFPSEYYGGYFATAYFSMPSGLILMPAALNGLQLLWL